MEDTGLGLVRLIFNLDDSRLAGHHGLTRIGDGQARARLGNLLDDQRLVAIVDKTELLDKVATLTLHIAEVVRRGLEGHAGTALLRPADAYEEGEKKCE